VRKPWSRFAKKRNVRLIHILSERPERACIAVYLIVANIFILEALSGWKYLAGTIPLLQLNANLLVYSTLLFLPWRIWLAGGYSRVAYTLLVASSVAPIFFGVIPEGFADRLVMFFGVIPVQLASVYFLYTRAASSWFLKAQEARLIK
jgi:hypothetical protein